MADVTNLFKATVKSVKSRNKSSGDSKQENKSNIFPAPKNRGEFELTARDVVSSISRLKDFLLEHRKDYVNAGSHLTGDSSRMTDADREQIDKEAEGIIKKCNDSIKTIKETAESQKVHPQVKEHREMVLTLVQSYLKVVCKIYSEQKAVRVKRVLDRKRISKIEPERRPTRSTSRLKENGSITDTSSNAKPSTSAGESTQTKDSPARIPSRDVNMFEDEEEEEAISAEEAQMFEQENKAMFEEMHSLSDEVRKIQGKVVEIASLQEIFTEKILEQEEDIIRIADTAVATTENVKEANEEIREAMKKNAGFRVWILFFLLVLTFSLLFLDWYSG